MTVWGFGRPNPITMAAHLAPMQPEHAQEQQWQHERVQHEEPQRSQVAKLAPAHDEPCQCLTARYSAHDAELDGHACVGLLIPG
jgi:hypothetical protein